MSRTSPHKSAPTVAPAAFNIHPDALIRRKQILGADGNPPLLAIGATKFHALIAEGRLPKPRKIGSASFWRVGDLLDAIARL
ncbi:helix-turn-helix transcriptional regulator [Thiomonas bhubaneswarensis]|uniref:Transcriptional regulator, AlpA family n=1 Tax=Thiomonas bhubaneswarensis TaxID=339866 RepID=A0A0K6I4X7_9BURK|nr:hypothetical protein [Thiomonas bhubaneswarensis]CUA98209.1 hypothetical protein Ga0061069_1078 [Thiomonas bhubaneswarensis]